MNNAIHRITLDIEKQNSMVYVSTRKGDTAHQLEARFRVGGRPYEIASGTVATLSAEIPGGDHIDLNSTVDGNVVTTVITELATAAVGEVKCAYNLSDGSGSLTTPPFTILVDESA